VSGTVSTNRLESEFRRGLIASVAIHACLFFPISLRFGCGTTDPAIPTSAVVSLISATDLALQSSAGRIELPKMTIAQAKRLEAPAKKDALPAPLTKPDKGTRAENSKVLEERIKSAISRLRKQQVDREGDAVEGTTGKDPTTTAPRGSIIGEDDPELAKFRQEVQNAVQTNFFFPWEQNPDWKTTIEFRLDKSGNPTDVVVVTGSGNPRFDRAVVDAIKKTRPFPPHSRRLDDALQNGIQMSYYGKRAAF